VGIVCPPDSGKGTAGGAYWEPLPAPQRPASCPPPPSAALRCPCTSPTTRAAQQHGPAKPHSGQGQQRCTTVRPASTAEHKLRTAEGSRSWSYESVGNILEHIPSTPLRYMRRQVKRSQKVHSASFMRMAHGRSTRPIALLACRSQLPPPPPSTRQPITTPHHAPAASAGSPPFR